MQYATQRGKDELRCVQRSQHWCSVAELACWCFVVTALIDEFLLLLLHNPQRKQPSKVARLPDAYMANGGAVNTSKIGVDSDVLCAQVCLQLHHQIISSNPGCSVVGYDHFRALTNSLCRGCSSL